MPLCSFQHVNDRRCHCLWVELCLLPSGLSCRAQSDKIFAQQSSLGKAQEEVRALRGQVEARAAQQGVIEAEIRRQVEEYGRLKRQLVDQEELQVGWRRVGWGCRGVGRACKSAPCNTLRLKLSCRMLQVDVDRVADDIELHG
jgi:hypothetical protein